VRKKSVSTWSQDLQMHDSLMDLNTMKLNEKNANFVYKVALDVRFGHELANHKF
jgi:hypothetical protein